MEEYAAASYCQKNTAQQGSKIKCTEARNCPRVEKAATKVIIGMTKYASLRNLFIQPVPICLTILTVHRKPT